MKYSNTREELLLNTIERYNLNNRSVDKSGKCYYKHPLEDVKCAIGIELNEEELSIFTRYDSTQFKDGGISNDYVFDQLPQRLQNMGQKFLSAIQNLHDIKVHWNDDGLSYYGLIEIFDLVKRYQLDIDKNKIEKWKKEIELGES